MRPSWIEIDLDAVEHNAQVINAAIGDSTLCAVVKADAYGHGDVPVAEAAIRGGAEWLAVALVEEGVRLREAGIDAPILILSEPLPRDISLIVEHGLTPTVYRAEFVKELSAEVQNVSTPPIAVHLKLDTGMHRVGSPLGEALEVAEMIKMDDRLVLGGVSTHFPVSDEDPEFTSAQNRRLIEFTEMLEGEGMEVKVLHAANTAAALDMPETHHDMCRVGLGIYGLRPHPSSGGSVELRPAMRLVSRVAHDIGLSADARPSYGRRRPLGAPGRVVTVPVGYADGVPRSLTAEGSVLINGVRYPFAGTITMDMAIIDVGRDEVAVGDEVVFIGEQGGDSITTDEWAEMLGTINYEIVCGFSSRLPRRYIERNVN